MKLKTLLVALLLSLVPALGSAAEQANAPSYMEYRFGTPAEIEMRYRGGAGPEFKFSRAEVLYASNASTVVWFKNDEVNCLLHFPMRGAPLLEVVKAGKTLAEMPCKNGWVDTVGTPDAPSPFVKTMPGGYHAEVAKYWGQ